MQKIKHDMNKTPMSPGAAGWIFGTVTKVDPLEIKIESGLTLPAEVLALSPFASEWKINTTDNEKEGYFNFRHHHTILNKQTEKAVVTGLVASPTISGTATVTDPVMHQHFIDKQETEDALYDIRMWRGLIAGDTVLLSRVQGGQQYVVWFRVSFLGNDQTEPDVPPDVPTPAPAAPEKVPSVAKSAVVAVTCPAFLLMLPIPASVEFSGIHYYAETKEEDKTITASGALISGVGSVILEPGYWTFSCEYEGTKYSTSDMIFVPFGGTAEATLS